MSDLPQRSNRDGGGLPIRMAVLEPVKFTTAVIHHQAGEANIFQQNEDAQKINVVASDVGEKKFREELGDVKYRPTYAEVVSMGCSYNDLTRYDSKFLGAYGEYVDAHEVNMATFDLGGGKPDEDDSEGARNKEESPLYAVVLPKSRRRRKRARRCSKRLGELGECVNAQDVNVASSDLGGGKPEGAQKKELGAVPKSRRSIKYANFISKHLQQRGRRGELLLPDTPLSRQPDRDSRPGGLGAGYMARRPFIKSRNEGILSPLAAALENEAEPQLEDNAGMKKTGNQKYLARRFSLFGRSVLDLRNEVGMPANPPFHNDDIPPWHHIDTKDAEEHLATMHSTIGSEVQAVSGGGSTATPGAVSFVVPVNEVEDNYYENVVLPMRGYLTPDVVSNVSGQPASRLSRCFSFFTEMYQMTICAVLLVFMIGSVVELLFKVIDREFTDDEFYLKGPNGNHTRVSKHLFGGTSGPQYVPITLFGDVDTLTLAVTLVSFALSALVSGFSMERMLLPRTIAVAAIFALITFLFQTFAQKSDGRYAGVFGGIATGLGIPACMVWITDKADQKHRGMIFAHIVGYLGIGIVAAYWKVVCLIVMVLTSLLLFLYQSVTNEERIGATLGGICNQIRRACRFEPALRTGPPAVFFRRMSSRSYRRPVIVVCAVALLQQLSGTSMALFLSSDYYKLFDCKIQWTLHNGIMTALFTVSTICHTAYMRFAGDRRLLFFLYQASYICALIGSCAASIFSYDTKVMACAPGILMSVAGLVGISGCLLIPVWTCSELLPGRIRPQGTGIVLALTGLANLFVLYGYPTIFGSLHPALPVCVMIGCSIGAGVVSYKTMPNMNNMYPEHVATHFTYGWLFHRRRVSHVY